jgi:dTDP-glucose pyrophosphorylase
MINPQGIAAAGRQPEATHEQQTERAEPAAVFVEGRHELRRTSQNACRIALDLSVLYLGSLDPTRPILGRSTSGLPPFPATAVGGKPHPLIEFRVDFRLRGVASDGFRAASLIIDIMTDRKTITKAVVLAAGRGTRMKSLTDDCPKPMLLLSGRPLLAHLIERMEEAGLREILLITGYKAHVVEDYFRQHPPGTAKLSYRLQEPQSGTGSAALLGEEFVGEQPFLLTFGDILVDADTYRAMFRLFAGAEAVLAVNRVEDPCHGAAVYVAGGRVTKVIEKPPKGTSTTPWINAGIYCVGPRIFEELARVGLSPRGEYELTDAIRQMLAAGVKFGFHEIQGFWRDVGRPEDLPQAEAYLRGKQ